MLQLCDVVLNLSSNAKRSPRELAASALLSRSQFSHPLERDPLCEVIKLIILYLNMSFATQKSSIHLQMRVQMLLVSSQTVVQYHTYDSVLCVPLHKILIQFNFDGCSSILSRYSTLHIQDSTFEGIRGSFGAAMMISRSCVAHSLLDWAAVNYTAWLISLIC